MQDMGYKKSGETQSRAVSALTLEPSRPTSPDKPMTPEVFHSHDAMFSLDHTLSGHSRGRRENVSTGGGTVNIETC